MKTLDIYRQKTDISYKHRHYLTLTLHSLTYKSTEKAEKNTKVFNCKSGYSRERKFTLVTQ